MVAGPGVWGAAVRTCACGCGTDLDALGKRRDALYASSGHRERVRRDKESDPRQVNRARESAGKTLLRTNRSGLQVSYWKAVEATAEVILDVRLGGHQGKSSRALAEAVLRWGLSDRQRAELDARNEPRPADG